MKKKLHFSKSGFYTACRIDLTAIRSKGLPHTSDESKLTCPACINTRLAIAKRKAAAVRPNAMGDIHFVGEIECEVRFVNQGAGFLFPTKKEEDFNEDSRIARHICYGKVSEAGEVTKL